MLDTVSEVFDSRILKELTPFNLSGDGFEFDLVLISIY